MRQRIDRAVAELRSAVSSLDASSLSGSDAEHLVEVLCEGERLCQAGRALASARVLRLRSWAAMGYRTPAAWLAARAQSSLSSAITAVNTAHRLDSLPATRDAFVSGKLSEVQAAEISAAAVADPSSEQTLLALASRETVSELRERCRVVVAAAASDEDACERIRRGRYLRHWADPDGAVRLDARLAPDDGALVVAAVRARAERLMDEAHRSGQRERADAYAADALVAMASGGAGPKAVVHVHVDEAALSRGRTVAGERCEIPGIGPVPVATARRLAQDGVVKALATQDADVRAVVHMGPHIPARVRTALEARDRRCVVPGCEVASKLEIDHIVPRERGGPTKLENLARLCRYHHVEKTHHGWRLGGKPGAWTWTRAGRDMRAETNRAPPARALDPFTGRSRTRARRSRGRTRKPFGYGPGA